MNKKEQIEEMKNCLCDVLDFDYDDERGVTKVDAKTTAEGLYNAGYRKADDFVREIIADVATLLENRWHEIQHGTYWLMNGRCTPLRELLKTVEKKYTEDGK